ncbi:hypothetical protein CY35_02G178800, partial [Sphagnum magellanicum]
EESNPPDMALKKRAASRQILKDDDWDLEIAVAVKSGTFRKASDAVLANQQIVKVRHTGTTVGGGGVGGGGGGGGGTAGANPFASICLVPSPAPGLTSDPSETIVALEKGDETEVPAKESDQPPTDTNLEAKNDAVAIEVLGEEKLGLGLEEQSKDLAKTGENGEASVGSAVGLVGSSSERFQQLSSAKTAFSGSFGTGFSSSTFTFGSTQTSTGLSSFARRQQLWLSHLSPVCLATKMATRLGSSFSDLKCRNCNSRLMPSLFEFLGGEWKEHGRAEICLNLPEDKDRRPRLVMRSKGSLRLLLNANLFPDMKLTKMDNWGVTFVCANSAGEAKVGLTTYAVRMKDSAMAADFFSSVQIHKGEPNTEPRTPESSPKAVDRLVEGGSEQLSEDIETGVKRDTAEV